MSIFSITRRWGLAALLSASALLGACGGGQTTSNAPTRTAATESASSSPDAATVTSEFTAQMGENAQLNAAELERAQKNAVSGLRPAGLVQAQFADTVLPVYRFLNTKKLYHFYTASQAERDSLLANQPEFLYEGIAFHANSEPARGLSPVHRFYNSSTGVHMYSISDEERANIAAHLPSFTDEGTAFYASKVSTTGTSELRRFYVRDRGIHFYSASSTEADTIRATLPNFVDEGPAFYTLNDQWTKPPVVDLTGTWTLTAQDSGGADRSGSKLVVQSQTPQPGTDYSTVTGQMEQHENGSLIYDSFVGEFHADGTLVLYKYVFFVHQYYKTWTATLNVAGNTMLDGHSLDGTPWTWTAVRVP